MQDALTARAALKQEVSATPPMLVTEAGGAYGSAGPAGRTRLQDAEDQLRVLLLKDTDRHPDVIAQRKLIDSLRHAPVEKSPSGATVRPAPGARSVPNAVYDQLKVKLVDADTSVVSLQRQRDEAVRYRDHLEKVQKEQPGLIAEYQNMDRDYNVLRKNYEELLERLQSANIAQAADTQADKVKLQIIDPPQIPRIPVKPNRMLLVTGVLLGGLISGVGITVLFGQLDQSFATIDDLRSLGLPVLGGISVLGLASLRQRLMAAGRLAAAVAVLVCVYGGIVVHLLRSTALI